MLTICAKLMIRKSRDDAERMLKAPPTILTPETMGVGFLLWLGSIAATSFAMNLGRLSEGWMFVVMSWPLVLGVVIVKIERIILKRNGGWTPTGPNVPCPTIEDDVDPKDMSPTARAG
jgi:hypothetical protein